MLNQPEKKTGKTKKKKTGKKLAKSSKQAGGKILKKKFKIFHKSFGIQNLP